MKESKMPIVKERGNNPRVLVAFMSFPPFGITWESPAFCNAVCLWKLQFCPH